jgi:2-dehydro-3-deoxygluconokinase
MSRIHPDEFDWKDIAKHSDWLHVSGITPALSPSAAATVEIALRSTVEAGCRRSLDLNYRSKLWSVERARAVFDRIIPLSTALFASAGDASLLFGIDGRQFAEQLLQRFGSHGLHAGGIAWIASTTRKESGGLRGMIRGQLVSRDTCRESAEYQFDIVDRIGAGDAFASGVIDGCLSGSEDFGIETAAIMAALQHTIPGDLPIMTWADIDSVRVNKTTGVRR